MADFYEEINNFAGGIKSAIAGDMLPPNTLSTGLNSAFRNVGDGVCQIGKRPGIVRLAGQFVNSFGAAAVDFVWAKRYVYKTKGTTSPTDRITFTTSEGELFHKKADDTFSSEVQFPLIGGTFGEMFASNPTSLIDGAVFNDRLFLVNSAGDFRSIINETYYKWGASPIGTISVTAAGSGSSSMPAGTYTIYVTSYNETTGAESSPSAANEVTITAGQRIRVQITPTSQEELDYTHWRIYMQRQDTQATAYRVLVVEDSGGSNLATDGDITLDGLGADTDVYIDLSAEDIANHILEVPGEDENDPPPSTMRYVATYGGRLIGADSRNIYWSKYNAPDQWPAINTESVDSGEGDTITGIVPFSDDLLLIMLRNNVYGLFGNDPQTWTLKAISRSMGCVGHQSICARSPLGVTWWSPGLGPVAFNGQTVEPIGRDKLGAENNDVAVAVSRYPYIVSEYDENTYRLMWAFASTGNTTNNRTLVFNTRLGEFESTYWYGMDTSVMVQGLGSDGELHLFIGGRFGYWAYYDPDIHYDLVGTGTVTGTVTGSTSISSLTGSGFTTSGEGLKAAPVLLVDPNGLPAGYAIVASNTSTVATFESSISGLISTTTYTWYIGGIDFRISTPWIDLKQAFLRKRFDYVYLQAQSDDTPSGIVGVQINFKSAVPSETTTKSFIMDTAYWKKKIFLIKNAAALRLQLYVPTPAKDFVLHKIATVGRTLSDRYYA